MAADHSDYTHGTMPVDAQEGTFKGFMGITMYGGALIAIVLLMPTLFYGANMAWMPALITTLIVGVVIGLALKFKGAWYASIIGLAIVTAIVCALASALI